MPQYAILIYGSDDATSPEELAEHDAHAGDLIESGALVAAFALESRDRISTVRKGVVTDGPYTEAREIIAGLGIIEADDLEAALAVARQNPATWQGGAVEVRPIQGGWIRGVADSSAGSAPGVPAAS